MLVPFRARIMSIICAQRAAKLTGMVLWVVADGAAGNRLEAAFLLMHDRAGVAEV